MFLYPQTRKITRTAAADEGVVFFWQRMRDSISLWSCRRRDRRQADVPRTSAFRLVRIPLINKMDRCSHPYRMRPTIHGFSHGLKTCSPQHVFTPVCALVPPFRILTHPQHTSASFQGFRTARILILSKNACLPAVYFFLSSEYSLYKCFFNSSYSFAVSKCSMR